MAANVFAVPRQREIQRLKGLGLKKKAVARTLKCSITTVKKYWNAGEREVVVAPRIESPTWTRVVQEILCPSGCVSESSPPWRIQFG